MASNYNNPINILDTKNAIGVGSGGSLNVEGGASIKQDTFIGGSLSVSGTSTAFSDNIMIMNKNPTSTKDTGILFERYIYVNEKKYSGLIYNETSDEFIFGYANSDNSGTGITFGNYIPIRANQLLLMSTENSIGLGSGGSLTVLGGASISKTLNVSNLSVISNNNTTLTTTGGNVGIGTSAPSKSLDIIGDINLTGDFYKNGDLYNPGSQWTSFSNNVVYTKGNIGINTTSPNTTLDVNGTANFSSSITTSSVNATNLVSSPSYTGGSMNLSGDLIVGGSVVTVNVTTTNVKDINISTGTINVSNTAYITNATIPNLTVTNISSATLTLSTGLTSASLQTTNANVTTATIATLLNTNAVSTNISSATLTLSTGLTSATAQLTNANVTTSTIATLLNTNAVSTNISSATLTLSTGITSASAQLTNANVTTSTIATLLNTNAISTNISSAALNLSTGLTSASAQITNANVTTSTVATLLNTNAVSTNISSATLNLSSGLTSSSAQLTNANVTTATIPTLLNTNIISTNISGGTISATTITGSNISLSGDLKVAGTLTTVNITSTNLVNTNVSAGVVVASTLLSATGNSNTIGNIFTTGGNVGVGTTSPGTTLDVSGTIRASTSLTTGAVYSTNITSTNVVATNVSAGTLNLSTGLTSASAQITNANVTTSTVATLLNTNAVSTNISSSTLNLSSGLTSSSAQISNANVTTATVATLLNTNAVSTNISSSTLNLSTSLQATNANVTTATVATLLNTNAISTNMTSTNIVSTNSSIGTINALGATMGGNLVPSTNITYDLGSTNLRWKDLYLSGNTIHLGNKQLSLVEDAFSIEKINIFSTIDSSSSSSGALIVNGGVGISKSLNVNGTVSSSLVSSSAFSGSNLMLSTGLTANNAQLTNANVTTSTIATLLNTNAVSTNISSATLNLSSGLTSASAQITNENVTTSTIATARVTTSLLAIGNSNTVGAIITTGGNVGIGTTAPAYKLQVNGDISFPYGSAIYVGGQVYPKAIESVWQNSQDQLVFYTPGANSNTAKLCLQHNGNVGIGTTAPGTTLDVSGTIRASTSLTTGALYSTNLTSTNVVATNVSAGTLNLSTGLTSANAQLTNANITTSTVATLLNTNAVSTNISSATLNLSTGLTTATARISNLTVTNISSNNITVADNYTVGAIQLGSTINSTTSNINLYGAFTDGYGYIQVGSTTNTTSANLRLTRWGTTNATIANFQVYSQTSAFLGGNVGIGTTAPGATLDVSGTIRASTSLTTAYVSPNLLVNNATGNGSTVLALMTPNLTTGGSMAAMFFGQTSGNGNIGQLNFGYYGNNNTQNNMSLTFFGGGGAQMYLVNNGNIGIGTTSPSELLTVNGNIRLGPSSDSNADYSIKSSGQLTIAANDASTQDAAFTSLSLVSGVSTNQSAITVVGSSTLKYTSFATSNTERMRIDSSGNVGIGTSSPNYTLDVTGSVRLNSTAVQNFVIGSTSGTANHSTYLVSSHGNLEIAIAAATGSFNNSSIAGDVVIRSSKNLMLQSGQLSPNLYIATSGNIGISTTSPTTTLDVSGTIRASTSITTGALYSTNLTSTNVVATNVSAATLNLSTGLTTASAQITNANVTTATVATLLNTNAVSTNISSATLNLSSGLTSASAQITNENVTTSTIATARVTTSLLAIGNSNTVGAIITTGGNVGIGTTSPQALLHLHNTSMPKLTLSRYTSNISGGNFNHGELVWKSLNRGVDSAIIRSTSQAVDGLLGWDDAGRLEFLTSAGPGALTRMVISESGNVGIGTTSPAYTLDVNGTARINTTRGVLIGSSTDLDTGRLISALDSGMAGNNAERYITFGRAASTNNQSELSFCNVTTGSSSNYLGLGLYGSRTMVINGAGNVGIGTTAPGSALHVAGLINSTPGNGISMGIGSDGNSGIQLNSGANGSINSSYIDFGYSGIDYTSRIIHFNNSRSLHFQVNGSGTSSMVMASTGNVGVGTDSPGTTLDVSGTIRASTSLTTGAVYSTNITSTNIVATNISAGTLALSNLNVLNATISNLLTNNQTIIGTLGSFVNLPHLEIYGTSDLVNPLYYFSAYDSNNIGSGFGAYINTAGSIKMSTTSTSWLLGKTFNGFNIIKCDGTVGSTATTDTRFIIATSGNIGIGTTTPAYTLDVNGTGRFAGKLTFTGAVASSGFDTATNDIYAEMRVVRNSTSSIDKDMFIQYGAGANSKLFLYSNNTQTMTLNGGSVGIGTTSPGTTLDVSGTIRASTSLTTGAVYSTNITSTNVVATNLSAGALTLSNINVSNATIPNLLTSNQSIVGTLGSFINLPNIEMYGTSDLVNPLYFASAYDSNNIGVGFGAYYNTSGLPKMSTTSTSWLLGKTSNGFNIIKCDGTVGSTATTDTRFTIATSGNIGIGTTSPSRKLHVQSDMRIGGSGAVLDFGDDFTTQIYRNATTSEMRFNTNSLERMTITSTGNLGIGTNSPIFKLDVSGNGRFTGPGSVGTNGSVLITGGDSYGHTLYVASAESQKRIGLSNNGTVGNIFAYDYGGGGAQNLVLQFAGGNVGIGTPTPGSTLHVNGGGIFGGNNTITQQGLHLQWNRSGGGGESWIINQLGLAISETASIRFGKSNASNVVTEQMRITESGSVGIGTASPQATLHVNGGLQLGTADVNGFHFAVVSGALNAYSGTWGAGTTRWCSDSRGNFGIGTLSPTAKLHVDGTARSSRLQVVGTAASFTTSPKLELFSSSDLTNPTLSIGAYNSDNTEIAMGGYINGSGTVTMSSTSSAWSFQRSNQNLTIQAYNGTVGSAGTAVQNAITFRNNGNVGIANSQGSSITSLLCVGGVDAGGNGALHVISAPNTFNGGKSQDGATFKAWSDGNNIIQFYNSAGVIRGNIGGNGASAVTYNTSSDRRLKENVVNMSNSINIVKQMRPVEFTWRSDNRPDYGFIAQEMYDILPNLRPNFTNYSHCECTLENISNGVLCECPDHNHDEPVDKEGNPLYYGLDYGKITPYLTKALQETIAELEKLRQDFEEYKNTHQ